VNMRRFMAASPSGYPWLQPERTMGNYVTIMSHRFDDAIVKKIRSELSSNTTSDCTLTLPVKLVEQIWSISAEVRGEIEHKLETGLKNDLVGTMKFVGDWRKQMANTAQRPRQYSWWVTGVGVLDGRPKPINTTSSPHDSTSEEFWAVRRAQFALSAETTAAAIMISPMTAAGEQLCVGVSWQDCICDASLGERIVADLEQWLSQIASS